MEHPRSDSSGSTESNMCGYLLKKSGKRLVKWKRRWFRLQGDVLLYYETDNSLKIKGSVDLKDSRGLRQHSEIKKIKHLPKTADENFVFGIASKRKLILVCADLASYSDWTWSLHSAITQYNPEVAQQSIGNFVGNRTNPFVWLSQDDWDDTDSSSSGEDAFVPTRDYSTLDLQTVKKVKSKQTPKSDWLRDKVKIEETADGLKMTQRNSKTKTETKPNLKYTPAKDRFNTRTEWNDCKSAPPSPTTLPRNKKKYSNDQSDLRFARASTPLGAMSSKVRSSLSKITVSGSMTDLRSAFRPQSSMERTAPTRGQGLRKSSSMDRTEEERRVAASLRECKDEIELFKQQIETFLGKEVLVEQDLTRMVEDRSLYPNGYQRFKGLRDTVRSVVQNLYKGLISVAEPPFMREEAGRVLAKFQFTLYQIPFSAKSPDRPSSSLMLQTGGGRHLEWEYLDPPPDCCLHYYLQLQMGADGTRTVDVMTMSQCEMFWESLLRGKESKFCLQIEIGVVRWQTDLEKRLGRRIGIFVDTAEVLKEVPDQSMRYKALEGIGSNFCQETLGRLVEILDKLLSNQLTQRNLRKRLRYIELGPLPRDSEMVKVVAWRNGGLLVSAKWHEGVRIDYSDIFQCFENEI